MMPEDVSLALGPKGGMKTVTVEEALRILLDRIKYLEEENKRMKEDLTRVHFGPYYD